MGQRPGRCPGKVTIDLKILPTDTRAPGVRKRNFELKDANIVPLNRDGVIIRFDEAIAKSSLKLTLEDGRDLGWESEIDDDSVTLQPRKGEKLRNAMTYIVQGSVKDFAGNTTDVKYTFVTKE